MGTFCETQRKIKQDNVNVSSAKEKLPIQPEVSKSVEEKAAKLAAASGLMSLLGDYGSDSDDDS